MRPTRKEFERPFQEYVRDVFRKNPDLPAFKVRLQIKASLFVVQFSGGFLGSECCVVTVCTLVGAPVGS